MPPTFHNVIVKNISGELLEQVLMLLTHIKRFGREENKKKIFDNFSESMFTLLGSENRSITHRQDEAHAVLKQQKQQVRSM